MVLKNKESVLQFVYSYPYEEALLRLTGVRVLQKLHKEGYEKAEVAQGIWNCWGSIWCQVCGIFQKLGH